MYNKKMLFLWIFFLLCFIGLLIIYIFYFIHFSDPISIIPPTNGTYQTNHNKIHSVWSGSEYYQNFIGKVSFILFSPCLPQIITPDKKNIQLSFQFIFEKIPSSLKKNLSNQKTLLVFGTYYSTQKHWQKFLSFPIQKWIDYFKELYYHYNISGMVFQLEHLKIEIRLMNSLFQLCYELKKLGFIIGICTNHSFTADLQNTIDYRFVSNKFSLKQSSIPIVITLFLKHFKTENDIEQIKELMDSLPRNNISLNSENGSWSNNTYYHETLMKLI